MSLVSGKKARIAAISVYFPPNMLTNDQLEKDFAGSWSSDDMLKKTGIASRHVVGNNECASDQAINAARKLFESHNIAPTECDFLILCTQSPDYFLPTTACIIHRELGLRSDCGALDFNQGCSGFVYGLSLAKGLIEGGMAHSVLLITSETYSKYIHPHDRSTRTIFGDAAAATWIQSVEEDQESIGPFVFGTDGRGAENLIVPAGGSRLSAALPETGCEIDDGNGNVRTLRNLYMNGPEIFTFSLKSVPMVVQQLLNASSMNIESVDYFIFHQANQFMLERLRKKVGIPESKFWINMKNHGNTVSSSIPIALQEAYLGGHISNGDQVMLVGFGVGYSWAATIVRIYGERLIEEN